MLQTELTNMCVNQSPFQTHIFKPDCEPCPMGLVLGSPRISRTVDKYTELVTKLKYLFYFVTVDFFKIFVQLSVRVSAK